MLNYIYGYKNGGDLNDIKTNFHKFVFNVQNAPENYGFLDVSHFNGAGFSPSNTGVIRQHFTGWNTGNEYTRCFYSGKWTPWISNVWKVAKSGDISFELTEKTLTLPENAKYAKEIIVPVYVNGAPDLQRNPVLVPDHIHSVGEFLYRSEAQKASVYVQLIDNEIVIAAHILDGLVVRLGDIIYR